MNFDDVTAIQIPEGNVKSIAIGGVTVWEAPVVDKYTWDAVFASIDAGTYAADYAIGDTVPLNLGSEGIINMQIAAFDADDLADGSGKAPITWIVKELLVTTHRMNPERAANGDGTYQEGTGAIGGWEKTEMRTYLKETIKPLIPENVRSAIKEVTKTHDAYNTAGTKFTQTSIEDVWVPDYNEVFDSSSPYKAMFPDAASRKKYKVGATSASSWWLSSAYSYGTFYYVTSAGYNNSENAYKSYGVALGFCT